MNDSTEPSNGRPAAAPVTAPAPPATAAAAPAITTPPAAAGKRRSALLAVGAVTLLAGLAYGGYWALHLRHYESTDNAYVQAPVVQVTSQVSGTVLAVLADDTDRVQAGQPLVKLDPADARLALDRAEAQLAQTVREVRTLYTNNNAFTANTELRQAEVARMQSDLARANDDVTRRKPLVQSGAVSGEEIKHAEAVVTAARSGLAGAQAALLAAQEQAASNRALTEGTKIEDHPNVVRAAAAVREAWLAVQRAELPAPLTGQVARRTVQVGQRIAAGTPLMSIIPLEQVWVEANFKEVQLRQMRIGQPVKLTADLYGSKVDYEGRVVGLGAGTGAAFALLPAQNATGNWIKVVQRVPVRVELNPQQLQQHPLRVGLSMEATVDIADQSGAPIAAATPAASRASAQTQVFDEQGDAAERRVQQIIAANLGRAVKAADGKVAAARLRSSHAPSSQPALAGDSQRLAPSGSHASAAPAVPGAVTARR